MNLENPKKVWKKNQKGDGSTEPDPLPGKDAAVLCQQQSNHDAEAEHGNRVFFFESNTGDDAKPQPVARVVALDRQESEINAAHPQQRLEAIGGHDAAVVEIDGYSDERQSGEHNGEPPATDFSRDHSRQNDRSRGCQRRNNPNTAKRVTQQEPGDLDEERYHRRLIHIAPGQMVPTSQVIEFVAEVTILIVEIEVQQEVQEGENQDDGHAIRKKGLSCMVEHRCLISGDFHLGVSRYGGALNTLRSSDSFKAE